METEGDTPGETERSNPAETSTMKFSAVRQW